MLSLDVKILKHKVQVSPEEDGGADVALSLRRFPLTKIISYLSRKHTCSRTGETELFLLVHVHVSESFQQFRSTKQFETEEN